MHHISFSKICYVQFVCLLFILFSIKKTFIRLKRNVVRNIIIFHGSPDCFYNTFIIITKEIQSYLSQSCSVFFKYVYIYIYFFFLILVMPMLARTTASRRMSGKSPWNKLIQ